MKRAASPRSILWVYMLYGDLGTIVNTLIISGVTGIVTFAASWGGVKRSVNGMREDVTEIKGDVKSIREDQMILRERVRAVEVRVEDMD